MQSMHTFPGRMARLRRRVARRWGLYLLVLFPVVDVFVLNYGPM